MIAHELGHVLGLGHSPDAQNLMAETLPAGVRRLPLRSEGLGEWLRPVSLSLPGTMSEEGDGRRSGVLAPWGSLWQRDAQDDDVALLGRRSTKPDQTEAAYLNASDAGLLAWVAEARDDDIRAFAGLRRDDAEDEHSDRVDRVFAVGDPTQKPGGY